MDMDQIFCSNQIVIPPTLPSMLKKYAKAAIRTQPYDLLVWSAAYFRAMATGGAPPVKSRLEFPLPENRQLTLGYVKLLVYQIGRSGEVTRDDVTQKWNDICLPSDTLYSVFRLGSFAHVVEWDKFVAITIGLLEESLKGTMLKICEVMTEEPDGGSAMIPSQLFLTLYRFLGEMDCGEVNIKNIPSTPSEEEKKPCLPEGNELDSISGKDIDSVIKEIGEVESTISIETRLEGTGMEFDWPNIESRSESDTAEIRFPSEPSDVGATSKYGIEVMAELSEVDKGTESVQPAKHKTTIKQEGRDLILEDGAKRIEKGEIKVIYVEKRRHLHSEKDSQISDDPVIDESFRPEDLLEGSITLFELVPTVNKNSFDDAIENALKGMEECKAPTEMESVSEMGSVITVFGKQDKEEESPSERDSLVSENKKTLMELEEREYGFEKNVSLIDIRPTLDRDLRRKMMDDAVRGEEIRKAEELRAAAEAAERQRIENEAKEKYHLHIPGIGPRLPEDLMKDFEEYIKCCALRQQGMVMPRNIRHFLCPPLDLERLEQSKDLSTLLEVAMQIPEDNPPSEMAQGFIEVINEVPAYYIESSAESSITSDSITSVAITRELSNASCQAIGQTTSLTQLLDQEK